MGLWHTFTGTLSDTFGIGGAVAGDRHLRAEGVSPTPPELKYNFSKSRWEYTHDGTNYRPIGDVLKTGVAPAGVINGINKDFTTPDAFVHLLGTRSVCVYLDGVRMVLSTHYSVSESGGGGTGYDTITFDTPPEVGQTVICDYYAL